MQLYWVGCSQVSSNYFRSFLHSCEVADFVSFIIPGDPYSRFTDPFTSSWASFGRVALESVVKSGGVEGKLGCWFGQNIQTRVWMCPCAYTMIVRKTKPVPSKSRWKICVCLDMGHISRPLFQINKVKTTLFFWCEIHVSWSGPHLQALYVALQIFCVLRNGKRGEENSYVWL